ASWATWRATVTRLRCASGTAPRTRCGNLAARRAVQPSTALDGQPDRLEQIAVDVVLHLVPGAVPDAHRRRVTVARQVAQLALLRARRAVDAVEDLQAGLGQPRGVHQPPEERICLVP